MAGDALDARGAKIIEEMVSIVVPVYNAGAFLAQTIELVQQQTYTHWELLLVDDASSDNSMDIAKAYAAKDERIKPILQKKNVGAAATRNTGIKNAMGRYLCFLDADDIWLADKLARELSYMQKKQAAFLFTGYEFADAEGRGLGRIVHVPETITYRQALKNTTIFTSTVMLDRRQIADEDIYMPQIASEDTATWWHILKKYGAACGLDENLVKYRRSEGTLSSDKLVAVKRIWGLYRRQEKLGVIRSLYCMCFWALRAVLRRV